MIRINLLPFRAARKKENVRRQISIFLLLLALTLILVFYTNYSLNEKIDDLQKKVELAKIEVKKYKKITAQINELKQKLEILAKQKNVIVELELNRKEPLRLLETMTEEIVPKRMWFTSLDYRNNLVSVSGIAIDEKTIADFMTNLENAKGSNNRSNQFSNIVLKSITKQSVKGGGGGRKKFEVQFHKLSVNMASKDKAKK